MPLSENSLLCAVLSKLAVYLRTYVSTVENSPYSSLPYIPPFCCTAFCKSIKKDGEKERFKVRKWMKQKWVWSHVAIALTLAIVSWG